jgi:hypothetical protein
MQRNCVLNPPELDLIWGVANIASTINRTVPGTYALIEHGHLPARKIGKRWCISRRSLAAVFNVPVAA